MTNDSQPLPAAEEVDLVRKTVQLPATLAGNALARAKSDQRSFSSYVRSLIAKDLELAPTGQVAPQTPEAGK